MEERGVHTHILGMVDKLKPNRKSILEEVELLHKEVEDLKKRLYALETLVDWGGSYIKELLEVVGLGAR